MRSHQQRVAVIAPSAPPSGAGGVASAHYHLYRCLLGRGVDAVLLTFNETGRCDALDVHRFGATPMQRSLSAFLCTLYLKARGSRKPAYQLHDIVASIPGVLKLNSVLRSMAPDHIIIPDHGAPGLFLNKGKARLTLVTHHNPLRFVNDPALDECCAVDAATAAHLEQRVLRKVDGVIAPSVYMEGVFRDTYRFPGDITTIPNPIDTTLLDTIAADDIRGACGLPDGAPLVYIPSAGSRLKGAGYLVRIIGDLSRNVRGPIGYYLSGTIPQELASALRGLPGNVRLYMPGHLEYVRNVAAIKACDFGISPTLIESFGMAILEANLCGVPMVVFRVGGTGEIVADGINGYCVPRDDVNRLVAAATGLLDERQRHGMSESCLRYSRSRFDAAGIIGRYLDFCRIGAHGGGGTQ